MQNEFVTAHRVQVNLSPDLYHRIRRVAFNEDVSISEVIRRSVREKISVKSAKGAKKTSDVSKWESFLSRHVGFFKGKKDDVARHDDFASDIASFR